MAATRREILAAAALGAAAFPPRLDQEGGSAPAPEKSDPFPISLGEWSLHRAIQAGELAHLDFPARAKREFGIAGVDYVSTFFKDRGRDGDHVAELARRCDGEGVKSLVILVDGEGELGHAEEAERARAVDSHRRWLDAAKALACHSIRVNAHGSGSREELAQRCAESLLKLAAHGEALGVSVLVENHGGLSSDAAWLAGLMKLADSPRVGTLPDFDHFRLEDGTRYDKYRGVAELMPWAKAVSAKSHDFDERGECVETDYGRMLRLVQGAGYRGWLEVEYEGSKLSEAEGIRRTKALIERVRSGMAFH